MILAIQQISDDRDAVRWVCPEESYRRLMEVMGENPSHSDASLERRQLRIYCQLLAELRDDVLPSGWMFQRTGQTVQTTNVETANREHVVGERFRRMSIRRVEHVFTLPVYRNSRRLCSWAQGHLRQETTEHGEQALRIVFHFRPDVLERYFPQWNLEFQLLQSGTHLNIWNNPELLADFMEVCLSNPPPPHRRYAPRRASLQYLGAERGVLIVMPTDPDNRPTQADPQGSQQEWISLGTLADGGSVSFQPLEETVAPVPLAAERQVENIRRALQAQARTSLDSTGGDVVAAVQLVIERMRRAEARVESLEVAVGGLKSDKQTLAEERAKVNTRIAELEAQVKFLRGDHRELIESVGKVRRPRELLSTDIDMETE